MAANNLARSTAARAKQRAKAARPDWARQPLLSSQRPYCQNRRPNQDTCSLLQPFNAVAGPSSRPWAAFGTAVPRGLAAFKTGSIATRIDNTPRASVSTLSAASSFDGSALEPPSRASYVDEHQKNSDARLQRDRSQNLDPSTHSHPLVQALRTLLDVRDSDPPDPRKIWETYRAIFTPLAASQGAPRLLGRLDHQAVLASVLMDRSGLIQLLGCSPTSEAWKSCSTYFRPKKTAADFERTYQAKQVDVSERHTVHFILERMAEHQISEGERPLPDLPDLNMVLKRASQTGDAKLLDFVSRRMGIAQLGLTPDEIRLSYSVALVAMTRHLRNTSILGDPSAIEKSASEMNSRVLDLMDDAQDKRIAMHNVDIERVIRIMGISGNIEGVENILRVGYGLDLQYLEARDPPGLKSPQPRFSSDMFNAVLRMLSEYATVGQMAAFFQAVRTPLPSLPSQEVADESVPSEAVPLSAQLRGGLSAVRATTKTYKTLIRRSWLAEGTQGGWTKSGNPNWIGALSNEEISKRKSHSFMPIMKVFLDEALEDYETELIDCSLLLGATISSSAAEAEGQDDTISKSRDDTSSDDTSSDDTSSIKHSPRKSLCEVKVENEKVVDTIRPPPTLSIRSRPSISLTDDANFVPTYRSPRITPRIDFFRSFMSKGNHHQRTGMVEWLRIRAFKAISLMDLEMEVLKRARAHWGLQLLEDIRDGRAIAYDRQVKAHVANVEEVMGLRIDSAWWSDKKASSPSSSREGSERRLPWKRSILLHMKHQMYALERQMRPIRALYGKSYEWSMNARNKAAVRNRKRRRAAALQRLGNSGADGYTYGSSGGGESGGEVEEVGQHHRPHSQQRLQLQMGEQGSTSGKGPAPPKKLLSLPRRCWHGSNGGSGRNRRWQYTRRRHQDTEGGHE